MRVKGAIFVALLLLPALLPAAPAFLTHPPENPQPLGQNERLSPQEAVKIAQQRHGGKVLSVQLQQSRAGAAYYDVKLLQNGNVRVVRIDAGR